MQVSWKGVAGVSESGNALLLVTLREEYNLVVSQKQALQFLGDLLQVAEKDSLQKDVVMEWEFEVKNLLVVLNKLQEQGQSFNDMQLETPWRQLPGTHIDVILGELKKNFAGGASVSISGTAPNYTMNYRIGTFLKSYPIPAGDFNHLITVADKLNNVTTENINSVLQRISKGEISAIQGLNELAGGENLAGSPLGGMALILAIVATEVAQPLHMNLQDILTESLIISPFNAGAILAAAGAVATLIYTAANAYKTYQEAEKARIEAEKLKYELEKKKQEDEERLRCRPERSIGVSAGGPAAEGAIDRISRTC